MKASLDLVVGARGASSFLRTAYFTVPFKLANTTENRNCHPLRLVLMSSSPGILDGDIYMLQVKVEAGAQLHLQTQAFQRLFVMKDAASQEMTVTVEDGGFFQFLPHPSVPHRDSVFHNHNRFFLHTNSQLLFGEVLTCGRKVNGELFAFTYYRSLTEIFINGRLVLKENLVMEPAACDPALPGQLEGFTHQASFVFLGQGVMAERIAALRELLAQETDISFGITTPAVNGILVRILGNKGEQLHSCLQRMANVLTDKAMLHE